MSMFTYIGFFAVFVILTIVVGIILLEVRQWYQDTKSGKKWF